MKTVWVWAVGWVYLACFWCGVVAQAEDITWTGGTAQVRCTNYCNLIVDVDERTRWLRVISHIDSLMKGQAGNALQNMNILFALPETAGLDRPGQYP